jgi:predicted Fe-S protein YdhL (DUF1289 family)
MAKQKGIPSPCISVCTVNVDTGFCNGCLRTLDEIECWPDMKEDEKAELLAELNTRNNSR